MNSKLSLLSFLFWGFLFLAVTGLVVELAGTLHKWNVIWGRIRSLLVLDLNYTALLQQSRIWLFIVCGCSFGQEVVILFHPSCNKGYVIIITTRLLHNAELSADFPLDEWEVYKLVYEACIYSKGGKTLEKVVQIICESPISGGVQGDIGWSSGQPSPVSGNPTQSRGLELNDLWGSFQQFYGAITHKMWLERQSVPKHLAPSTVPPFERIHIL